MAQVYLSQYSKRAALADSATSATLADTASYISILKLDPNQDPNPTGLLYTSSTYLFQSSSNTSLGYDLYFRQNGNITKWKWIEGMLNTGLLYGGVLSYSASSFLITPGAGLIVNHNAVTGSEISPMIEYVTWGPITQSIENIAAYQNTFVYIDSNGSASQQNVFFTPEQYQIYIPIGRVSHYNNVIANNTYENVQTVYDIDGQQNVFVRAFGPLKLTGMTVSGQTGTLRLNVGSGTAFNLGGYYPYNPENPSTYNMSTYNTASIIRIYRSGSGYKFDDNGGSYYTTINPANYDNGTGILASVGNGEWSIQRVMVNPVTGRAHVYYAQSKYATYDEAVGAISSDSFIESDATAYTYPFVAYLILRGNTTNLLDTANNKIVEAGLFRNIAGGGGTGGGGIPGGQNTQIQFNNAGVFDGEPEFTFDYLTNTLTLTGSMLVDGVISASFGANTIGFYGTSSWTVSASQALTSSRAFSSSYALSASQATTSSYALTSSFSISASYASSSHNFANTDLVFTGDRKHDTNKHSFFLYSDLIGGNETDPFDGFGVSGSFYYFNSSSNALGTAAGSTNTYTYIQITSQSIDLSFNANPIITKAYRFTATSASFSGSLTVTNSLYLPGLTTTPQSNVVVIDTTTGQLYYTASSAFGGGGGSGDFVPSTWTGSNLSQFAGTASYVSGSVFNSTNPALSASYALTASFVQNAQTASFLPVGTYQITSSWATSASQAITASYILQAVSASFATFANTSYAAPLNTSIQFNSGGLFSGSQNFTFNYTSQSLQQGYNVTSSGLYQTVFGNNNITSTSQSAFIIGDGGAGLVFDLNRLAVNVDVGDQNGIIVSTSSLSTPGVFIPNSYFIGGTITFTSASVSETFTITAASDNGTTRYFFNLNDPVGYDYNRLNTTLTVTGGPNAKHNLLFASQSWFELDTRNAFIKNLLPSTASRVIGYNPSSGQLSHTTIFPYSGSAIITGSLIVNDGTYDIINTPNLQIKDASGDTSIDWANKYLQVGGLTPLNWGSRQLADSNSDTLSLDWENRTQTDASGNTSIHWHNRTLFASDGATPSLNWSSSIITTSPTFFTYTISSASQETFSSTSNFAGTVIEGLIDDNVVLYNIVYQNNSGRWFQNDQATTASSKKLGIYLGNNLVLTEGHIVIDNNGSLGPTVQNRQIGFPIFIREGAGINMSCNTPNAGYVRILGHIYYQNQNTNLHIMRFNPSNDYYLLG